MRKLAVLIIILLTCQARADELAIQLNGYSWHDGVCTTNQNAVCNSNNNGIGIEYALADGNTELSFSAGQLKNSVYQKSTYAGAAWQFGSWLRCGLFIGYLRYPAPGESSDEYFALLPIVSLRAGRYGLTAVFIPPVMEKVTAAVMIQMRFVLTE